MNYCDCGDYCEWCHPELVYGADAREAFPYFDPCRICGHDPCICELPWEEEGFDDE